MPRSDQPRRPTWNEGVPSVRGRAYDAGGVEAWEVEEVRLGGALEAACSVFRWRTVVAGAPFVEAPGPVLVARPPGSGYLRCEPDAGLLRGEWDGAVLRIGASFDEPMSFYGTGEVAGPLLRNGRATEIWNTDAWCYGEATRSLYQSHPWVLGLRPDGRAIGLYAATARRGRIEVAEDGVELAFEGGGFELYVLQGPSPREVLAAYTALIGRAEPPPAWALGYHQSRWGYATADEVRAVVAEFRARDLPLAAVWLDIDHLDRWRVFTWDEHCFPDPRALVEELHAQGVRVVAIVDPGIAVAQDYDVYRELLEGGHAVALPGGAPALGRVWPGVCAFPDFTRAETRAWWAARVRAHLAAVPLDGIWCDMNEPSCTRTAARTLPDDACHAGSPEASGGEPPWPAGDHARWHNLYGHGMAWATHAGVTAALRERGGGERPFVLTRAAHASTARYAATWTGDNQARWEDLAWAIPMVLNLGLSGQPFAGPDVGGFYGDPSPELFARWFEACALLPFFRGHSEKTSCRKEPWSFGPEVEARVRAALYLRERLRPRLEAAFEAYARTGAPPVRPLWWADPADPDLRGVDDAYLLGDDLLVAPFLREGRRVRTVLLPGVEGGWRPLWRDEDPPWTGTVEVRADEVALPVFQRAPAPS